MTKKIAVLSLFSVLFSASGMSWALAAANNLNGPIVIVGSGGSQTTTTTKSSQTTTTRSSQTTSSTQNQGDVLNGKLTIS